MLTFPTYQRELELFVYKPCYSSEHLSLCLAYISQLLRTVRVFSWSSLWCVYANETMTNSINNHLNEVISKTERK